jgi:hypothetical protein
LRNLYGFARRHFQCRRYNDLTKKRTTGYFANGDTRNATKGRLEFVTLAACVHSETSVQPTAVRWRVKLDDPHGPNRGAADEVRRRQEADAAGRVGQGARLLCLR